MNKVIKDIQRQLIRAFAALDECFDNEEIYDSLKQVEVLKNALSDIESSLLEVEDVFGAAVQEIDSCEDYILQVAMLQELADDTQVKHITFNKNYLSVAHMRKTLRKYLAWALDLLDKLDKGRGINYMLTVKGHGKIINLDCYHYLYFLALRLLQSCKRINSGQTYITNKMIEEV